MYHRKFYQFSIPNVCKVDDTIFTLPEIMGEQGYTTAAVDNLIIFPYHHKQPGYINTSPGPF